MDACLLWLFVGRKKRLLPPTAIDETHARSSEPSKPFRWRWPYRYYLGLLQTWLLSKPYLEQGRPRGVFSDVGDKLRQLIPKHLKIQNIKSDYHDAPMHPARD